MTTNPAFDTRITHSLLPSSRERLSHARGDLVMGLPCLLSHKDRRAVIAAVETLSQDRFDALCFRFGKPDLLLTAERARALLTPDVDLAGDVVRLQAPALADLAWFKTLSDTQFDRGHHPSHPPKIDHGPETPLQVAAIRLVKLAELIPAVVSFDLAEDDPLDDFFFAALEANETIQTLLAPPALARISAAALPLESSDIARLHIFRDPDGTKEHYAIEIGSPDLGQPVLSRVHSACFTGDVLGSLKCDCGPQLRAALARMGQEGSGMLLYLNQEGRGIGLANKMRVYDLQAQGFDTVDANNRLGFDDDERDFRVASLMLRRLGVSAIRLLTNNPAKVQAFHATGIDVVEQIPLRTGRNPHNDHYLSVKALKSGHSL